MDAWALHVSKMRNVIGPQVVLVHYIDILLIDDIIIIHKEYLPLGQLNVFPLKIYQTLYVYQQKGLL